MVGQLQTPQAMGKGGANPATPMSGGSLVGGGLGVSGHSGHSGISGMGASSLSVDIPTPAGVGGGGGRGGGGGGGGGGGMNVSNVSSDGHTHYDGIMDSLFEQEVLQGGAGPGGVPVVTPNTSLTGKAGGGRAGGVSTGRGAAGGSAGMSGGRRRSARRSGECTGCVPLCVKCLLFHSVHSVCNVCNVCNVGVRVQWDTWEHVGDECGSWLCRLIAN
jgi:hypothetical protein